MTGDERREVEKRKYQRRVAFIAHALLPGYHSSELISRRLVELGRDWPKPGDDPGFIRWFSFPVLVPAESGGENVWVDFYIIPVCAPQFLAANRSAPRDGVSEAYKWSEAVALHAIAEAKQDGVPLWVGWGAAVKNATDHGAKFLEQNTVLLEGQSVQVSTTHGDAGTAALALHALRNAGVGVGASVAVVGANGPIGEAIARALPSALDPSKVVLIGRPDKRGQTEKQDRLVRLQREVRLSRAGNRAEVIVHQDKSRACLAHETKVVVVVTTGMDLFPGEVPEGSLVVDLTTPSACDPKLDWSGRTVIVSGCGQFTNLGLLPDGFGEIAGQRLTNVGAAVTEVGGEMVIWGCTGETIIRAMFGEYEHIFGPHVRLSDIKAATKMFEMVGFASQPPVSFGKVMGWGDVAEEIARNNHD